MSVCDVAFVHNSPVNLTNILCKCVCIDTELKLQSYAII